LLEMSYTFDEKINLKKLNIQIYLILVKNLKLNPSDHARVI